MLPFLDERFFCPFNLFLFLFPLFRLKTSLFRSLSLPGPKGRGMLSPSPLSFFSPLSFRCCCSISFLCLFTLIQQTLFPCLFPFPSSSLSLFFSLFLLSKKRQRDGCLSPSFLVFYYFFFFSGNEMKDSVPRMDKWTMLSPPAPLPPFVKRWQLLLHRAQWEPFECFFFFPSLLSQGSVPLHFLLFLPPGERAPSLALDCFPISVPPFFSSDYCVNSFSPLPTEGSFEYGAILLFFQFIPLPPFFFFIFFVEVTPLPLFSFIFSFSLSLQE